MTQATTTKPVHAGYPTPAEPAFGLPVAGYKVTQPPQAIEKVNRLKVQEERALRELDALADDLDVDGRWVSIARTHLQQAYMAAARAVFQPQRIDLPGDPV